MHHCPRCLKLTDGVHTCTPTPAWREMELTITKLRQQIAHLNDDIAGLKLTVKFVARQHKERTSKTKPTDYAAFDAELLRLIAAGNNRMMHLESNRRLLNMAKPFAAASKGPFGVPEWRVIDRRLQALRKKGVIAHDGKAWAVAARQ